VWGGMVRPSYIDQRDMESFAAATA
jgi:hypothetical protein